MIATLVVAAVVAHELSTGDDVKTVGTQLVDGKRYWLDDLDHDPVTIAKSLTVPMLFVRGDADFQVFDVDLAGWKAALADHANVATKTYAGLNHLFMPSSTHDTSDYKKPSAVDARVIDDIVSFVRTGAVR